VHLCERRAGERPEEQAGEARRAAGPPARPRPDAAPWARRTAAAAVLRAARLGWLVSRRPAVAGRHRAARHHGATALVSPR